MKQAAFAEMFATGLETGPREQDDETRRRLSNKLKVLTRLQEGPATTLELIAVGGTRAPGRANELKHEGYPVVVEDLGGGKFRCSLAKEND